jgi:hypothetical protein
MEGARRRTRIQANYAAALDAKRKLPELLRGSAAHLTFDASAAKCVYQPGAGTLTCTSQASSYWVGNRRHDVSPKLNRLERRWKRSQSGLIGAKDGFRARKVWSFVAVRRSQWTSTPEIFRILGICLCRRRNGGASAEPRRATA